MKHEDAYCILSEGTDCEVLQFLQASWPNGNTGPYYGPRVSGALRSLTDHLAPAIADRASVALAIHADSTSEDFYISRLETRTGHIRAWIAGLGNIASVKCVPTIARYLDEPENFIYCIYTFAHIGGARAEGLVAAKLGSIDRYLDKEILSVLARIGGVHAADAIIQFYNSTIRNREHLDVSADEDLADDIATTLRCINCRSAQLFFLDLISRESPDSGFHFIDPGWHLSNMNPDVLPVTYLDQVIEFTNQAIGDKWRFFRHTRHVRRAGEILACCGGEAARDFFCKVLQHDDPEIACRFYSALYLSCRVRNSKMARFAIDWFVEHLVDIQRVDNFYHTDTIDRVAKILEVHRELLTNDVARHLIAHYGNYIIAEKYDSGTRRLLWETGFGFARDFLASKGYDPEKSTERFVNNARKVIAAREYENINKAFSDLTYSLRDWNSFWAIWNEDIDLQQIDPRTLAKLILRSRENDTADAGRWRTYVYSCCPEVRIWEDREYTFTNILGSRPIGAVSERAVRDIESAGGGF